MTVIDVHVHAFPDRLASRAVESLRIAGRWEPLGDGTVAGLLAAMDAAGVDLAVLCPIATRPGQVRGIFRWVRKLMRKHGDRLLPMGSVHPADRRADRWVRRFAEAGLAGLKLHPFYQGFVGDEETALPLYAAAAETSLPVAVHCGQDIAFPDDAIPDRASPARYAGLLDRLADLRLLCTHLGGWRDWDAAREHLIGREVYIETSSSLTELCPERLRELLAGHDPEKICFGTDWPWNDPAVEIGRLRQAGLDGETLDRILWKNATRLLGF